jgi:hypothetical protein
MKALLDKATITAAFRATGHIAVKNRELFDLDVASLRVLVENIIFADQIVIADNYKEEHSAERKGWLNYPNIRFQGVPDYLEKKFLKHAAAHVWNWKIVRELGTDLDGIFDELSILFRHAWRNSESFLVLKALGIENKYNSQVVEGLREFCRNNSEAVNLVRSKAKHYNQETQKVVQSLTWSANRAVYYRQLSKLTGTEYVPHPLRNTFNLKCILYDNHPDTRKYKSRSDEWKINIVDKESMEKSIEKDKKHRDYVHNLNNFFRNLWTTCNQSDDNAFGIQTYDIDMPPFLAYILKKINRSSAPQEIIDKTFELREDRGCTSLRRKLIEIHAEPDMSKKHVLIREFAYELRDFKHRMQVYLGYERERVSLSAKIISYGMTVPRCIVKPLYPHKPHLAFMRDVILELASVSTMGRLMDQLWNIEGRMKV